MGVAISNNIDFGRPNIVSTAVGCVRCRGLLRRRGSVQDAGSPELEPLCIATMSLQVNLSDRDINSKYQEIVNATSSTDWVIFTYDKGTNDLKVQASGDSGLDEMVDEFMDSR